MNDYLDAAPCGYIRFTDAGEIILINATLAEWLGYKKEELAGKSVETIFTLATRIFYNTHFYPMLRLHARAEEIFLSLLSSAKNDIPVLANAARRGSGGAAVNECVFMQVKQRRKYEDEILNAKRQAEKALEENAQLQAMAKSNEEQSLQLDTHLTRQIQTNENLVKLSKVISHDLQEPLRKVRLFAGMLQVQYAASLPENARSLITKIEAAGERMQDLTIGLHQYLTVDENKMFSPVDLIKVLQSATEKVKVKHKIPVLDITHDRTDITIDGYPVQVELMFTHLIDNAVKFRHPGRSLEVRVSFMELDENLYRSIKDKYHFSRHVRIVFSDNGIGFDPQYKDHIFQILNKLEPATSGIGLGLSLVKRVVDNHNGHVKVSSSPDAGTTFTIDFPITQHTN